MIVDTIANAGRYRGIAPLLDRGLEEMGRLARAPLPSLEPRGEYSEADDIAFFTGSTGIAVPLEPGWFTVQFPQDAHKPGCPRGGPSQVRKLVIKVAA